MATNPKDRSLCTRKAAIGKKPWPNLPQQILNFIAWQPNLMHNISYPGTTKSWRAPPRQCSNKGKSQLPQLSDTGAVNSRDSIQTLPRFVNIYFRERFPWPYGRKWSVPHIRNTTWSHYVGVSQGVLVTRGTEPSEYNLLDPFQRSYSMLPLWDVNVPFRFAVLSASPFRHYLKFTPKICILVLTGNSNPAFAICRRGGDKYAWETHDSTIVDPHDPEQQLMKFTSAITFDGKFYALSLQGTLAVMEDINSHLSVTAVSTSRAVPSVRARRFRECLLESNGEVLLLFLIYQKSITTVDQVEIFRLHFPKLVWVKMESLGDRTLFVEPECCLWVTASKVGCRSNCVYFTEGAVDGWWIYDLKSGSISPGRNKSDFSTKSPVWDELLVEELL